MVRGGWLLQLDNDKSMPQFVNLLFLSEALSPLPCGSYHYLAGSLLPI